MNFSKDSGATIVLLLYDIPLSPQNLAYTAHEHYLLVVVHGNLGFQQLRLKKLPQVEKILTELKCSYICIYNHILSANTNMFLKTNVNAPMSM